MEGNHSQIEALFREEALSHRRQTKTVGDVIVTRPLSFNIAAGIGGALVLAIVLYCFFGSYAPRKTVMGQLVPEQGVAKMYSGQPGTIAEILVREGQAVKKGDVLYRVMGDRKTGQGDSTDAEVARFAGARKELLVAETERQGVLARETQFGLEKRIADLEGQQRKLDERLAVQKTLVELAESTMGRYEALADQGYVSRQQFETTKAAALQNRAALYGMERDRIAAEGQITSARIELRTAKLQAGNQISQLNRQISSATQDVVESESRGLTAVVAPFDGVATAITAAMGEHVTTTSPVISVVPRNSRMRAKLMVPSSAVGFVKEGDRVRLRYAAFPYQKFGTYGGIVAHISQAALAPADAASIVTATQSNTDSGPTYQMIVNLDSQFVNVYGAERRLPAGMSVSADILQDRRRIYQWIISPLYTLRGKGTS